MGSEVGLFVLQTEFFPNVFPVEVHRIHGEMQHFGDFFGGFPLLDKGSHLYLSRCEIEIL